MKEWAKRKTCNRKAFLILYLCISINMIVLIWAGFGVRVFGVSRSFARFSNDLDRDTNENIRARMCTSDTTRGCQKLFYFRLVFQRHFIFVFSFAACLQYFLRRHLKCCRRIAFCLAYVYQHGVLSVFLISHKKMAAMQYVVLFIQNAWGWAYCKRAKLEIFFKFPQLPENSNFTKHLIGTDVSLCGLPKKCTPSCSSNTVFAFVAS